MVKIITLVDGKLCIFADEVIYNMYQQAELLKDMPISARFVAQEDFAMLHHFEGLEGDDLAAKINELKADDKIKHVTALDQVGLENYVRLVKRFGGGFHDLGAGLGKEDLTDPDFERIFEESLDNVVRTAKTLGVKEVRIFPFYPGKGSKKINPGESGFDELWAKSLEYSGRIAKRFQDEGLVGVYENEVNLIAPDGDSLVKYLGELQATNMYLLHDAANLVRMDVPGGQKSLEQFKVMLPYIVAMHFKDAVYSTNDSGMLLEDAPWPHRVIGKGDGGYSEILPLMAANTPAIEERRMAAGLDRTVPYIIEGHALYQSDCGGVTQRETPNTVNAAKLETGLAGIMLQQIADIPLFYVLQRDKPTSSVSMRDIIRAR